MRTLLLFLFLCGTVAAQWEHKNHKYLEYHGKGDHYAQYIPHIRDWRLSGGFGKSKVYKSEAVIKKNTNYKNNGDIKNSYTRTSKYDMEGRLIFTDDLWGKDDSTVVLYNGSTRSRKVYRKGRVVRTYVREGDENGDSFNAKYLNGRGREKVSYKVEVKDKVRHELLLVNGKIRSEKWTDKSDSMKTAYRIRERGNEYRKEYIYGMYPIRGKSMRLLQSEKFYVNDKLASEVHLKDISDTVLTRSREYYVKGKYAGYHFTEYIDEGKKYYRTKYYDSKGELLYSIREESEQLCDNQSYNRVVETAGGDTYSGFNNTYEEDCNVRVFEYTDRKGKVNRTETRMKDDRPHTKTTYYDGKLTSKTTYEYRALGN